MEFNPRILQADGTETPFNDLRNLRIRLDILGVDYRQDKGTCLSDVVLQLRIEIPTAAIHLSQNQLRLELQVEPENGISGQGSLWISEVKLESKSVWKANFGKSFGQGLLETGGALDSSTPSRGPTCVQFLLKDADKRTYPLSSLIGLTAACTTEHSYFPFSLSLNRYGLDLTLSASDSRSLWARPSRSHSVWKTQILGRHNAADVEYDSGSFQKDAQIILRPDAKEWLIPVNAGQRP